MGRLIKVDLARLIVLAAASCLSPNALPNKSKLISSDHMAASIEAIFWPKIFWDFLTKRLDKAIKPAPVLQTINLIFSLLVLAYEWPLKRLTGSILHRSIKAKLWALPLPITAAILIFQGTDPAIYYTIGAIIYMWAAKSGEYVLRDESCCSPSLGSHRMQSSAPEIPPRPPPCIQERRTSTFGAKQYPPYVGSTPSNCDPTFRNLWQSDRVKDSTVQRAEGS